MGSLEPLGWKGWAVKYGANIFSQLPEKSAARKPVAVVSSYGRNGEVEKMEVSIIDADGRSIAYKSWINDGMKSIDQVTDEVILFATNHHVGQIQMVDELLPLPT